MMHSLLLCVGGFSAAHHKTGSGHEDTGSDQNASFSLRATLPSHAKLRPPRAGPEQANGNHGAKDLNSPDESTTSGLQQEDQSAEKYVPVLVEEAALEQKAVEVQTELHGTESALAISRSAEEPGMQLDAANDSEDQPKDEDLPRGNPEGVPEEIKPHQSHRITVMVEGRGRSNEEDMSDVEMGADLTSETEAEEDKEGNRLRADSEGSLEEGSEKLEKAEEDMPLHAQENHEVVVEKSPVEKEREVEMVHPGQPEEEESKEPREQETLPEEKEALWQHLNTDTLKDEQENKQDDQSEAEAEPEADMMGRAEESEEEEEEEGNTTTKEQPRGENEQGSSTPEPQEKTEHETQQSQNEDGGEQEPHVNTRLDEERTEEHDGEDDKIKDPERKRPDVVESGSASAKEEVEEVNGNQREQEEREDDEKGETTGQHQIEYRPEDGHGPDEDTVSVNSEQDGRLVRQASDTGLERQPLDCHDVSVMDENEGEEREMQTENERINSEMQTENERIHRNTSVEDTDQGEQNPLKAEEDESIPKDKPAATEEQERCLAEDQMSCQGVSVTGKVNAVESEIRSECEGTESNTATEGKKQEEQNPVQQGEEKSILNEPIALEEQDRCSPDDQRTDSEVISGDGDDDDEDKAQDEHEQDVERESVSTQEKDVERESVSTQEKTKDAEEKVYKQEQTEQDEQRNDTNSPAFPENETGTPEKRDEEKALVSETETEKEHSQEAIGETCELPKDKSGEDVHQSGQRQNGEQHLEDEERGQEEDKGVIIQDYPLKEGQHVDVNLEDDRQHDSNYISEGEGEKDNEHDAQTRDLHLAKEKSECEAEVEVIGKVEGEAGETDSDKGQEDPAEGECEVMAVDDKEHNGSEDQMFDSANDHSGTETTQPAGGEDVERRPDVTRRDGQQDEHDNSTSDEYKTKEDDKDDEINKETDKETLEDEEKRGSKPHQGQTDSEIPGQTQKQSDMENHDDDCEEPVKGKGLEELMEEPNSANATCEELMEEPDSTNATCGNQKDGRDVTQEKNENGNDSESDSKEVTLERHQDDISKIAK